MVVGAQELGRPKPDRAAGPSRLASLRTQRPVGARPKKENTPDSLYKFDIYMQSLLRATLAFSLLFSLSIVTIKAQSNPKPKQTKVWCFEITNNIPSDQAYLLKEIKHNKKGQITSEKTYKKGQKTVSEERFEYPSKNSCISYLKQANRQDKTEQIYNKSNQLLKRTRYDQEGNVLDLLILKYNKKGEKSSEEYFNEAEQLVYSIQYHFDPYRLLKKAFHRDATGKEKYITATKVSQTGQPLNYNQYKSDGPVLRKALYKYDSKGHLLEIVNFKGAKIVTLKTVHTYNEQGLIEKTWVYAGPTLKLVEHSKYSYTFY
jgi:hypothetical protein